MFIYYIIIIQSKISYFGYQYYFKNIEVSFEFCKIKCKKFIYTFTIPKVTNTKINKKEIELIPKNF